MSSIQFLKSPNGKQIAILQDDGNFVLYDRNRNGWADWATNTRSYDTKRDANLLVQSRKTVTSQKLTARLTSRVRFGRVKEVHHQQVVATSSYRTMVNWAPIIQITLLTFQPSEFKKIIQLTKNLVSVCCSLVMIKFNNSYKS